jgi:hypothetical protein
MGRHWSCAGRSGAVWAQLLILCPNSPVSEPIQRPRCVAVPRARGGRASAVERGRTPVSDSDAYRDEMRPLRRLSDSDLDRVLAGITPPWTSRPRSWRRSPARREPACWGRLPRRPRHVTWRRSLRLPARESGASAPQQAATGPRPPVAPRGRSARRAGGRLARAGNGGAGGRRRAASGACCLGAREPRRPAAEPGGRGGTALGEPARARVGACGPGAGRRSRAASGWGVGAGPPGACPDPRGGSAGAREAEVGAAGQQPATGARPA